MKSASAKITQPSSHATDDPARVRPSMRWLGLSTAAVAWVFWPWGGLPDPFDAPKWVACAFGFAVLFGLLGWERGRLALRSRPVANGADSGAPAVATRRGRFAKTGTGSMGIPKSFPVPGLRALDSVPFRPVNFIVLCAGAALIGLGLLISSLASPAPLLGLRIALRELVFVLAAVIIAEARPRRLELRWVIGCFLFSAAAQGALALTQYFWIEGVAIVAPNLALGRGARGSMLGAIGNPEYLAGWLAPALVMAAVLLFASERKDKPRWEIVAVALLALAAIYFSGGRGAILAVFAACTLLVHMLGDPDRKWRMLIPPRLTRLELALIFLLIALFATLFLFPGATKSSHLPARLKELANVQSDSMRHRIGLYTVTTRMILDHPFLGAGPGRFGAAYGETQRRLAADETGIAFWAQANMLAGAYVGEAHCDPLQWWAEYGLLPIVGLSLMLAAALGKGRRVLRRHPEIAALWGGLLALSLTMGVGFPLHEASRAILFWVMMGLLAGVETPSARQNVTDKEME